MKLQAVFVGFSIFQSISGFDSESPACVSKCWDNSQYASACSTVNERLCLCDDAQFQNVMLQCLYSQCQTSQFGPALHQTLIACFDETLNAPNVKPPLIRYQSLRKRGTSSIGFASGHLSASAVHSVARRSVSASAYPTLSARANHRLDRRTVPTLTTISATATPDPSSFDIKSDTRSAESSAIIAP